MDHLNLRQDVSDFALETQCDHIQQLRESYEQVIQTASEKSWLEYWEETRKPGEKGKCLLTFYENVLKHESLKVLLIFYSHHRMV